AAARAVARQDGGDEEDADGGLRPVLVDFGTVWSADLRTMTRLGQFVGTPAYMAPEQVRGRRDALGPAADVYALGATLYALLTGVPPFDGQEPIRLLQQVLDDDAPRLRSRWPEAPRALEAIVARCLAKEPSARYASASDLASDLRSQLAGRPVAAQATGWSLRVARRVRGWRRPLQVAIAIAALTAIVLSVLGWRAQQRRTAVQRYDPIGASFEGTLRAAYMSPQHDVQRAQMRVRARVVALETALAAAPGPARAPMRGAIGRGWLALDETARGLQHLRAAWDDGHRTPGIAYAIGRGLSSRYAVERQQIRGMLDSAEKRARQAEAVRRYRDPARTFLERGRGAPSTAPSFVEALLRLHDDEYEAALRAAERARGALPWQHEADALIGTIHQIRGRARYERGDFAGSWRDLRAADRAHRRALRAAPSDPHLATSLCDQRTFTFAYAVRNASESVFVSSADAVAHHDAARVACVRALRLAPDDPHASTLLANIAWHWAMYHRWISGADEHVALRRGWAWGQRARRLDPAYGDAHDILSLLAMSFAERIDGLTVHGDPRPWFDLADLASRRAADANGDALATLTHRSGILRERGVAELAAGQDPHRTLQRAAAAAEAALQHAPDQPYLHYRVGMMYSAMAEAGLRHGRVIDAPLARSTAAFRRALAGNLPAHFVTRQIGLLHFYGAQQAFDRGEDHRPWIEHAVQPVNDLLARAPELQMLHDYRASLLVEAAHLSIDAEIDPAPMLRRAATSLRALDGASIAHDADAQPSPFVQRQRLLADLADARWRWRQGTSIDAPLASIDRWLGDGPTLPTHLADLCRGPAVLHMRRALAQRSQPAIARADRRLAHCLDALARRPDGVSLAEIRLNQGTAALLRAYAAGADIAQRTAYLAEAERHWGAAETINRWLARRLAPLRREARILAAARDPHAALLSEASG
ncbi:MAG: hypothetical protein AAF772_13755, partial [Acidobacteriota bacterium]